MSNARQAFGFRIHQSKSRTIPVTSIRSGIRNFKQYTYIGRCTANNTSDNDGRLHPAKQTSVVITKNGGQPCPLESTATTPSMKQCNAVNSCGVRKTSIQDSLYLQGILRQRHGMFVKTGWWFVLENQSVDSRCLKVTHCTELMILPVGRQLLLASRHW